MTKVKSTMPSIALFQNIKFFECILVYTPLQGLKKQLKALPNAYDVEELAHMSHRLFFTIFAHFVVSG